MRTVSVIIPVYNAEKYISRCLDSILSQSYSDFEILLINDGSKDSSLDICVSYEKNNDCIRVINQDNMGCSIARNVGIEHAEGSYILFVDADDMLTVSAIQDLIDCAQSENAEIVIGTVNKKNEPTKNYITVDSQKAMNICINRNKYINEYSLPQFVYDINPGSPWMKLIRRDVLTKNIIKFPVDVKTHHEDTLFCMDIYSKCQKIILLDSASYLYNIGVEGSLCNTFFVNKIDESIILMSEMLERMDRYLIEEKELKKDFIKEILLECWADYFTNIKNNISFKEKKEQLRKIVNNDPIYSEIKKIDHIDNQLHQKLFIINLQRCHYILILLLANIIRFLKMQRK